MAVDRFCRNTVGPPEWEYEAMGSVVWVQCATSAECVFNLSIAVSSVMGMGSYWGTPFDQHSHDGMTYR